MMNARCQIGFTLQPSLRDSKQRALRFPAINCWATLTHPSGMFPEYVGVHQMRRVDFKSVFIVKLARTRLLFSALG
jgi:hypothetical protein